MAHFKDEKTLVVIKPDGIQRSLIGDIIKRYEQVGLKLIGIKMLVPTPDFVEKHYTVDPNWKKISGEKSIKSYTDKGLKHPVSDDPIKVMDVVLEKLKKYMASGPVIAMAWQGAHAVGVVRKITGGTEPRSSDVGTIRGDWVLDSYEMADADNRSVRNLIHASGTVAEAEAELALWFKPQEFIDYALFNEKVLYDVNLDGILE
jgi:nucleoside-diphosphate kinase